MNTFTLEHEPPEPTDGDAPPGAPPETWTAGAVAVQAAQLVALLYGALARRDPQRVAEMLHPDVVLHVPGTHPLAGTYKGIDELLGFTAATTAATDDGESIEPLEVLVGTEHVAVRCRVTATRGDRHLDNSTIHLLKLRGARVAEIHLHNFDGRAVDDFWS